MQLLIAHSLCHLLIQLHVRHFLQENTVRNHIESFEEIQNDDVNQFPSVSWVGNLAIKGHKFVKQDFTL